MIDNEQDSDFHRGSAFFIHPQLRTASQLPSLLFSVLAQEESAESQDWSQYFDQQREPEKVRELVLSLHKKKQYEDVIAILESALINGQSQPWMYEVLALTMKIVKRPQEDIERVLLSITDFTPKDVPNLLYSAAYLTRFDANDQALKLYRQASRLEPARAEPYVLGLKIADKVDDVKGIEWAATGILRYDWTKGHEKRHKTAIQKLKDWKQKLADNGDQKMAHRLENSLASSLIRDLAIRLEWSGEGELDLLIEEPGGTTCSFETPLTRGGGALVHDGVGNNPEDCYESYVVAYGLSGHYRIHIKHVQGNIVGKRAQLSITRYQGTPNQQTKRINVELDAKEVVYKISLHNGRRKALANDQPTSQLNMSQTGNRRRISSAELRQRIGNSRSVREFQQSREQSANGAITQAVGYTPVITPLQEGASMSATATVSADRRYVRVGIVPLFTNITDVFTFSFVNGGNAGAGNNQGNNTGGN